MSSVRIRLITRDEDVKVDDSPLYVPVGLKRYGLSEVVNQLLKTTEPIPFDFLVDGKLLRTSLDEYLASEGLSTESVISIEYVRAILPPSFVASYAHDDWVSAVKISSSRSSIATGSYDGVVRIWDRTGNVEQQLVGHAGAIKDVKWLGPKSLVSASMDRTLVVWKDGKVACALAGHTASVNSIAVLPSSKHSRFVSASTDGTLKLWSTNFKELPEYAVPTSNQTSSQKRRRLAAAAMPGQKVRGSLSTLTGHTAPVSGVAAHPTLPDVVYSVSEDHTLRTWDLVTSQAVDTKTTKHPLLCVLPMGEPAGLIACGSSARHIILIDPRATTTTATSQLNGHRNFVVDMVKSPTNPFQLASASHDGTVRIWDLRANKSMYTIERQGDAKDGNDVYCVDWADVIVSGGRDKRMEVIQVPENISA